MKQSRGRGAPLVELTYNWAEETYDENRFFGHLAYEVDDIYLTCERLRLGITVNRPPRDGQMAFVRSPDLHSIELLQKGDARPSTEPWSSMPTPVIGEKLRATRVRAMTTKTSSTTSHPYLYSAL